MGRQIARGMTAFPVVALALALPGCSFDEPTLVQANSPAAPSTAATSGWIEPACLGGRSEEALTFGVLFEADQRLVLDRDDGGKILSWAGDQERASKPTIVLDSGMTSDDHVEGAGALCARVNGIAGWQIVARLADIDDAKSTRPVDLGDFANGYLELELKSDVPVAVVVTWATPQGTREGTVAASEFAKPSRFGHGWMTVRIPLCRLQRPDLSAVLSLVGLYPLFQTATSAAFYCADAIRWVRPGSCPATCK